MKKIVLIIIILLVQVSCKTSSGPQSVLNKSSFKIIRIGEYPPLSKEKIVNLIKIDDYNKYLLIGYIKVNIKITDYLPSIYPLDFLVNIDRQEWPFPGAPKFFLDNHPKVEQAARELGGNGLYLNGSEYTGGNNLKIVAKYSKNIVHYKYAVLRKRNINK